MAYAPDSAIWDELSSRADLLQGQGIARLFRNSPARGEEYTREAAGIRLDFSRQLIDDSALGGLLALAEVADVLSGISSMFAGGQINTTEGRPALHVALRRPANEPLAVDGHDVMPKVEAERQRMAAFVDRVHRGEMTGFKGKGITDVINIGIGGSDLGIVMAVEALTVQRNKAINVHCVSNIDGARLHQLLDKCDPATTLFVVCSKSFTTLETQTNAAVARQWLVHAGGEGAVKDQFAAVSTNHGANGRLRN